MTARRPALAAYMATDPAAFPLEAHTTVEASVSTARATPTNAARSLNDPEGLSDSSLARRPGNPTAAPVPRSMR